MIQDLGFTRRSDGFFYDAGGKKLAVEQRTTTGDDAREKSLLVIADQWKSIGVDAPTVPRSWFDLQLDYNISAGGNSGIMFHVTDEGGTAWATGPEFQLEDNAKAGDPQRCGWLYGLYQPPIDPKTDKPLDATKPAGQWNHVRLLLTPEKCDRVLEGLR